MQLVGIICIHSAKQCAVAKLCRVNNTNNCRISRQSNNQLQQIKHAGQSGNMHICEHR